MQVERIDHVHVEVANRDDAAVWYETILGLTRDPMLAAWAEDPMGPLILSAGDGAPALSLFERGCAPPSRDTTIAFRVSGAAFRAFVAALPDTRISNAKAQPLTGDDVVDHDLSHSIYFVDPDGNRLELTTYEIE